jgi:predicted GNAT family acetyltransferase
MRLFRRQEPQLVTNGRFEIERDGQIAYLEYSLSGDILALIHSEVPEALRGQGLGSSLAQTALEWARENHKKVDVICPSVSAYIKEHLEFSDLLIR